MSTPKSKTPQPFITAFWMQDQNGLLHTQEQPLIEFTEYAYMVRSFLTNAILITSKWLVRFSNDDHIARYALILTTYPKQIAKSVYRSTVIDENMQLVDKSEILKAESPKKIRYFNQTFKRGV